MTTARPPASACARAFSEKTSVSSPGLSSDTGSRKTSMVPPQVSPISQASSSPRSSSSSRGAFWSSTSADCSMTWASTQPPIVTEPSTRPPSPTTILAPSLRGVVPRVLTRVATVTRGSVFFSLSRWSNSSDMRLLQRASPSGHRRVR